MNLNIDLYISTSTNVFLRQHFHSSRSNVRVSPPHRTLTLGEDRGLPCELLEHLSSTGQSVTTLTDTDVQAELANAKLPHGVLLLLTLVLEDTKCTGLPSHT